MVLGCGPTMAHFARPAMSLKFLEFDASDDTHGLRSWSALAAPAPVHACALRAEVNALTEDLRHRLGEPGPLDEGHLWDMALDIDAAADRTTVSMHLSGGDALADLLAQWGIC